MKKAAFAALAVVLVSAALAAASCVSSWSDGGYLVIGFGGGRNVSWPPSNEEVSRMKIDVTLDGPGGPRNVRVEGRTSVTVPLEPGRWKLRAEAFVDDKLRAVSDTEELEIKPGRNYKDVALKRPPALTLALTGAPTFLGRTVGYATLPAALNVTVTNAGSFPTGPLTVAFSAAGASFTYPASLPGLPLRNDSTSFTVQPKTGLIPGTHAGTVTVSGDGMDASFDVSFTVLSLVDAADFGSGAVITDTRTYTDADGPAALQTYLSGIATTPGNYIVTVEGTGHQISSTNKWELGSGVTISLRGSGTITKTNGTRIEIKNGAKLILRGPTLEGNSQSYSMVWIESGGRFAMESGAIANSNNTTGAGGGVHVGVGGIFVMNDGSITGNGASSLSGGAGVMVGGIFTMNGGAIANNNAGYGAGVRVDGTFTMTGGTITGNIAGAQKGGGVWIKGGGTFNLDLPATTASISGNTSGLPGPNVSNEGTFLVDGVPGSNY